MASKGQKFASYSLEFKNGGSDQLAKHYNISSATIWNWISKERKQSNLENDINHKRWHHKKPVSLDDWKERYEILKKYRTFLKAQRERK